MSSGRRTLRLPMLGSEYLLFFISVKLCPRFFVGSGIFILLQTARKQRGKCINLLVFDRLQRPTSSRCNQNALSLMRMSSFCCGFLFLHFDWLVLPAIDFPDLYHVFAIYNYTQIVRGRVCHHIYYALIHTVL